MNIKTAQNLSPNTKHDTQNPQRKPNDPSAKRSYQTPTFHHDKQPETLCWTCAHCTCAPTSDFLPLSKTLPDGRVTKQTVCPWAAEFKPIPNWLATARVIKTPAQNKPSANAQTPTSDHSCPHAQTPETPDQTYTIHACPYYKPGLEARVSAMTDDELKRLLGLPYSFCNEHRKFVTQLAISYIKEMETLAASHKENPEAPYPQTKSERFAIRRAVVRRHKYYLECDLETLLEDAEQDTTTPNGTNDDEMLDKTLLARETRITKGDIALCDMALKAMKRIQQRGFSARKTKDNA